MVAARHTKFERVTVTFVPTQSERGYRHVPTTFSTQDRTYQWRHAGHMGYMIVPLKIANDEIKVDIFIDRPAAERLRGAEGLKSIEDFVKGKIQSEWEGLKLAGISRVTSAEPPHKKIIRGTIEEIIGTILDT